MKHNKYEHNSKFKNTIIILKKNNMKTLNKIAIAVALLTLSTKIATAQTLSVGPMVGVNLSTITAAPNTQYLAGVSLGGFGNYSINSHFGINAKLLYNQFGSAYTYNGDINRLHYIQLPVTGVYFFGEEGQKLRPKVYAGLYVASLLKATHKSGDEVLATDGTPMYNKLDVGGVLGLGFNYRLKSRTWLNVDAGYNAGFSDLTKIAIDKYHNKAFSLNVGVSFPVR
jgi:hypothetical protein